MVGRSVTLHSPDSGAQLLASTYGAQGLHMKGALTLRRRASGRLAPMRTYERCMMLTEFAIDRPCPHELAG